jgi:hypothetical protein
MLLTRITPVPLGKSKLVLGEENSSNSVPNIIQMQVQLYRMPVAAKSMVEAILLKV